MIVLPAPGSSASRKRIRGNLHEVAVDRLQLVRQRIDAGDRQREERIVFVGQTEAMGLDAEAKQSGIAVERLASAEIVRWSTWSGRQHRVVGQPSVHAAADQLDSAAQGNYRQDLDRLGQRRTADDGPDSYDVCRHGCPDPHSLAHRTAISAAQAMPYQSGVFGIGNRSAQSGILAWRQAIHQ